MAKLWLMAALLLLSASDGSSVDPNKLAKLIDGLMKNYKVKGMLSLAVSIPKKWTYDLDQVIKLNDKKNVKKKLSNDEVYKSQRLVAAKVEPEKQGETPEHAEYRVLNNLKLQSQKGDLLIIYSYASPCPGRCTKVNHEYNIIDKINTVVSSQTWGGKVFVFEMVFKPKNDDPIKPEVLIQSLRNLETSGIPLKDIFRCYNRGPKNAYSCTRCFAPDSKLVNPVCYTYDSNAASSHNVKSPSVNVSPGGTKTGQNHKNINKSPRGSNEGVEFANNCNG